jgi:hypothetical protein
VNEELERRYCRGISVGGVPPTDTCSTPTDLSVSKQFASFRSTIPSTLSPCCCNNVLRDAICMCSNNMAATSPRPAAAADAGDMTGVQISPQPGLHVGYAASALGREQFEFNVSRGGARVRLAWKLQFAPRRRPVKHPVSVPYRTADCID